MHSVMVSCEQCGADTEGAPVCPVCGHKQATGPLDLEDYAVDFEDDSTAEAMIIGNLEEELAKEWAEPSAVKGALLQRDGSVLSMVYYSAKDPSQMIDLDAVPQLTHRDVERQATPYEGFILGCLDGKKTVREIAQESPLLPLEMVVGLVALEEKGLVELRKKTTTRPGKGPTTRRDHPTFEPEFDSAVSTQKGPRPAPLHRPPKKRGHSNATTATGRDPRPQQAQKLFEQAVKDKDVGNFASAQMNLRLARAFDPDNQRYAAFSQELVTAIAAAGQDTPQGRAAALYEEAVREEKANRIDRAIALLEKALQAFQHPAYYNRLGVIYAMRKHDVARACQLINLAIQLAPGNETYQHNLAKLQKREGLAVD